MRYWAIFLASLGFVLPSHGQEVIHRFPPTDPVMFHTDHTASSDEAVIALPSESSPMVNPADPADPDWLSKDGPEGVEAAAMHGDTCDCADCGRLRHQRSGWNPFRRVGAWWANQALPHLIDTHWGYDQYFDERPFGIYNSLAVHAQINQAAVDQLMLYQYDFEDHSAQLRPRGHKQLQTLATQAERLGQPLIIQETADRQLDEQRKAEVVNRLVEMGVAPEFAHDRVHIGAPTAFGLARGGRLHMDSEPELIWQNQLLNSQQQGQTPLGRAEDSIGR
ncbi:MAG: hypothetical protein EA424_11290 [Planctomycetaceae bacterium]|nr:MAG: hypothetical protein EA424_11290 [Planctomycetaceae bacterium]